jgi:cell division protein FtsL
VRTLPDHRLLDRLIGGRIWIVLLGTLLVGIVTMQLSLLRLNAGIGRAVEKSSTLEQRNAALRLSISELSNSERIVALASQMGFVTPPQGSPHFLTASATDAGKALTTMRVPDPTAVAAATAVETTTTDPSTTTDPTATIDPTATPVETTSTDTSATAPVETTTDPTTVAPAADTTPPATDTATPVTASTPVAGGASAPQG